MEEPIDDRPEIGIVLGVFGGNFHSLNEIASKSESLLGLISLSPLI
jgi:hypothetical protein